MAPSLILLLLCPAFVWETYGNLIQFGRMVNCVTGRNAILSYSYYGCYCGLGGSGWPVDDTDWCCHAHDCCYRRTSTILCDPFMVHYKFSCRNGDITCGNKDLDGCARRTCECDRRAALCFRKHNDTYSDSNNNYNKITQCLGNGPPC
ncbi:phospholipase A2-like [Pseudophryne corroboree]|uniref:phospholipase A2-like n=1 Tax=Pseudophryne corroboree TaxID=495146 RepID=UPI00308185F9